MIDNSNESEHYRLALEADPTLRALDQIVGMICEMGLPCSTSWSDLVKPLTTPHLGVMRGCGVENADNPSRPDQITEEIQAHLLAYLGNKENVAATAERMNKYRLPATNGTEEWLRTSEAWDAMARVWIRRMQDAAPADGTI
ncbi:hypothetical protein ACX80L_06970 [Arthrobacter sp. MDT1-48-3]